MLWWFLAILTIFVTGISARFLIAAVQEGPVFFRSPEFSVTALKIGRYYRILSWSIITLFLLGTLIQLFIQAVNAV